MRLKSLPLILEIKEKSLEVNISKSSLADNILSILDDAKAENLKIIDLSDKSSIADSFIIATCRSTRHADATADDITKKLKKLGIKCPNPEGRPQCDWIIVDAGSIIVHLFRKEIREIYNLEKYSKLGMVHSRIN